MKYEYTIMYFKKETGKLCGMSHRRFDTKREATELAEMLNSHEDGEFVRVARRKVCKWEVMK